MENQQKYYQQVGQRIKKARDTIKLSQSELGKLLGISGTAISLYETGDRYISVKTLGEIAKITGVTLEELAHGYPQREPDIPHALRADHKLRDNTEAQKQILDFIDWVKNRSNERTKNRAR